MNTLYTIILVHILDAVQYLDKNSLNYEYAYPDGCKDEILLNFYWQHKWKRSTYTRTKTVGNLNYRYRLGHLWVSEMMLNVQSVPYLTQGYYALYGISQ